MVCSCVYRSLFTAAMLRPLLCLVLAAVIAASPTPFQPSANHATPQVTVKNGTYQGVYSPEYNQDFFRGIRYAQPPVGNLRFRAPQSFNESWNGTRDASTYPPHCVGYGVCNIVPEKSLKSPCFRSSNRTFRIGIRSIIPLRYVVQQIENVGVRI